LQFKHNKIAQKKGCLNLQNPKLFRWLNVNPLSLSRKIAFTATLFGASL
jgi:hypothetical protein